MNEPIKCDCCDERAPVWQLEIETMVDADLSEADTLWFCSPCYTHAQTIFPECELTWTLKPGDHIPNGVSVVRAQNLVDPGMLDEWNICADHLKHLVALRDA